MRENKKYRKWKEGWRKTYKNEEKGEGKLKKKLTIESRGNDQPKGVDTDNPKELHWSSSKEKESKTRNETQLPDSDSGSSLAYKQEVDN